MPSEITPSSGPPRRPNIESDICRTVAPSFSHKNARPTVIIPNIAAINIKKVLNFEFAIPHLSNKNQELLRCL